MKVIELEESYYNDEQICTKCPICGVHWEDEEKRGYGIEECEHLRFVLVEGGGTYFNNMNSDAFEAKCKKIFVETGEGEEEDFNPEYINASLLEKVEVADVDEVINITQHGIACGPVAFNVLWGYKK